MSRFCTSCGTAVEDTTRFCPQCGSSISAPTQQPPSGGPVYYTVRPSRQPRPGRGFGISSMVLGIIGAAYSAIGVIRAIRFAVSVHALLNPYNEIISSIAGTAAGISFSPALAAYPLAIEMEIFAILGALAIIFGGISRKKGYRCGISISGLILGSIGLVLSLVAIVVIYIACIP